MATPGPHQQRLADVLDAGDRANISAAELAWLNGGTVLAQVAGSMDALEAKLREAAADPTGVVFTGATARAAVVAFGTSAKALNGRALEMGKAAEALGKAGKAMDGANKVRVHLDTRPPKDAGPEPRPTSSNPSQEELDEHRDWKKKEAEAQADREQRERVAREALVDLRAAYKEAALPMKKIHGEPDPEPPKQHTDGDGDGRDRGDGGDGGDDGDRGGRNPEVRPPRNPEVEPPVCTLPPPVNVDPPVVVCPGLPEVDPDPPIDNTPDDEGTRQWTPRPPTELPTGTPPNAPGNTSVSAPGGGLGSIAAGAGLGGVGAAAGGLAAGLGGRPMAVPTGAGGPAAGARGALGGTPRAGGSSVLGRGTPGVAGQATPRGGARGAGAAGRGTAGKGAGGARGAAGASGSRGGRGAGGAGAAGGRRGGKDRDRRGTARDLFDDGQDWLDDEEQGPGVLD